MPITFPRVNAVEPGQLVTSSQMNQLARALNARLLSGVGDGTWRWAYWCHNLTSQIRSRSGEFAFPHIDEYLKLYTHAGLYDDTIVMALEDDPPLNLTNPLAALAFGGNIWGNMPPEHDRLGQLTLLDTVGSEFDALAAWQAAKSQRGYIDPDTGHADAPALDLAMQYTVIGYNPNSFHGKTYGGYLPTPNLVGDCGDGTEEVPSTPIHERIFTNRLDHSTKTYLCCCSADAPTGSGTVAGIGLAPGFYLIFHQDGSVERLSRDVYSEGPYQQGRLRRDEGHQLEAVMHEYVKSLRGADSQRDPQPAPETIGFDWQTFMERQYPLAPAHGLYNPTAGPPRVDPLPYRQWTLAGPPGGGTIPAGTMIGESHIMHTALVVGGWAGWQANLKSPVTVEILYNGQAFDSLTLSPISGTDNGSRLSYLPLPVPLAGGIGGVISLRLVTAADFNAGGLLTFEILETIAYAATLPDAYLVARCFASVNAPLDDGDEHGSRFLDAKAASDQWFTLGVLGGKGLTEIQNLSRSVLHESARRMINDGYRLLDWRQLRSYYVNTSGQSVFEFRRKVDIAGTPPGTFLDKFEGIGPSLNVVVNGKVQPGIVYRVEGGTIDYGGAVIAAGAFFMGVYGGKEWTATAGSPLVYEHNVIRDTPVIGSETNRWVMHLHSTVFSRDSASFWNPELYDDAIRLSNRCHTFSDRIPTKPDLWRHFSFLQSTVAGSVLFSESVPGHTYAEGFVPLDPDDAVKGKYYCSCRIYTPPYELLAAEAVNVGGEDRIRLIFKGRLDHDATHWFPGDPNTAAWPTIDQSTFDRRTDENAVIMYLKTLATGTDIKPIIGDYALNLSDDVILLPDDPWGAYLPRLHLMKLVPEVSADGNATVEDSDQVCTADQLTRVALYLRAICEGWVDQAGSAALACAPGSHVVDFSFQTLMQAASGGQYPDFPLLPLSVRADVYNVRGAGPLSNTFLYAEHFNLLASAVNLLTRSRLEIPVQMRSRTLQYEDRRPISATGASEARAAGGCDSFGGRWFDNVEILGASTLVSTGAWSEWTDGFEAAGYTVDADTSVGVSPTGGCELVSKRNDIELELRVTPGADCALPPGLADSLGQVEIFGNRSVSEVKEATRVPVSLPEQSQFCDNNTPHNFYPFHDGSGYYAWEQDGPVPDTKCVSIPGKDSPPGLAPLSDLYQGKFPPGGGAPEGYCSNAVSTQVTFSPEAAGVPVIAFTLTDPPPAP